MPIAPEDLAAIYPRLYHMAEHGGWPQIRRHGLLSTSALLDLFEIEGAERAAIETAHRPECVTIQHAVHGTAVIRDQKPMSDRRLSIALRDGLTPADWYRLLNARTFFWLTRRKLETMLGARAYRQKRHTVLTVDTEALLARHEERCMLSPMNSGCTVPMPFPRGLDTFQRLAEYPFAEQRKKRGLPEAIIELAVDYSVPDVANFVLQVEDAGGGLPAEVIWSR